MTTILQLLSAAGLLTALVILIAYLVEWYIGLKEE
jgi:hypothetical protein